jgi:hypothetical protein
MRKSRFSEEQIAMALRQAEAGTTVDEVCRKLGVSQGTLARPLPTRPNELWAMDFMHDTLARGETIRVLTAMGRTWLWSRRSVSQAQTWPRYSARWAGSAGCRSASR